MFLTSTINSLFASCFRKRSQCLYTSCINRFVINSRTYLTSPSQHYSTKNYEDFSNIQSSLLNKTTTSNTVVDFKSQVTQAGSSSASSPSSTEELPYYHTPILLTECLDYLQIKPNGLYIDCTLGGGGHTKAILERGGKVIGLDQDLDAIQYASKLLAKYIESNQLEIIRTNFRNINQVVTETSRLYKAHLAETTTSNNISTNNNNDPSQSSSSSPFSSSSSSILQPLKLFGVDGVLMDLGISSHQIDFNDRGFSFANDGPLDMRMNQDLYDGNNFNNNHNIQDSTNNSDGENSIDVDTDGQDDNGKEDDSRAKRKANQSSRSSSNNALTAYTIVNTYDTDTIANILYDYGDETRSRQIAREIVNARPLYTTHQLATTISRITPWKYRPQTLSRCFQALRIVVNDEINALEDTLQNIHHVIRPGGRLAILSYHSLEDRRVKNLFRYGNVHGEAAVEISPMQLQSLKTERMYNMNTFYKNPIWNSLLRKAVVPSEKELEMNKRSRSAKLRVAERIVDESLSLSVESSSINSIGDNSNESNNTSGIDGKVIIKKRQKTPPVLGAKQLAKLARQKAKEDEEKQ